MKGLRNVFFAMLFLLVGLNGFLISGCNNNNDNMSISLNTTSVEIILGENNNSATVYATVLNAADKSVTLEYDSVDVNLTTSYIKDGVTQITIVAYRQCSNVDVKVVGAKKTASFTVSATTPISSIVPNQSSYSMSYDKALGGTFSLSNSLFQILPEGTNQTQLNFSLSNEIDGVSIENNILTIQPNLNNVPSGISVEVVSAFKEDIKATIQINVVNNIDMSLIEICDIAGAVLTPENTFFNIPRNNPNSNILTIAIKVPFSVTTEKLSITPKFKFGDCGIVLNDSISEKFDGANGYYFYTFNFSLAGDNYIVGQDQMWFEICYQGHPDLKFNTLQKDNGILTITTYDEITNISLSSNGATINTLTPINIYTSYETEAGVIEGYAIKFEAVPSTAIMSKLALVVDTTNSNLPYLVVKNSKGSEIDFVDGRYAFDSGETFYFMVKKGFEVGAGIDISVESEENAEIQKTITFNYNEGISQLGFVDSHSEQDSLTTNRTYYLESAGDHSSTVIKVAIAPSTITLESAKINKVGDNFSFASPITVNGELNGAIIYEFSIQATKAGEGSITFEFESGHSITCNVVVVNKLENVSINIEPTFNTSSSVGEMQLDENNSLKYVALKNGHSLPIVFNSDAEILSTSYSFSDYLYTSTDDVYGEDSAYNAFENDYLVGKSYTDISNVISGNYLRALSHISPVNVGKVWVKATFTGKQVQPSENGKELIYADTVVEKYFLVEVYNPIVSISLDTKHIQAYAYDEVGESNKNLSYKTLTIELNKGGLKPTYDKIVWSGVSFDEETGLYEYFIPNSGVVNFTITDLTNGQYKFSALTRNADSDAYSFKETDVTLTVKDLGLENEWNFAVKVTLNAPQLVETINVQNVSEDGINLLAKNLTNNSGLTSFKLYTEVLPETALNREVVYKFIPNNGTSSDIITISEDGIISVTGDFGGEGIIRIIPKDSIFKDQYGHEYYRDNLIYSDVKIIVSDGTKRETAIRISDLSEITNTSLHYVLMQSCTYVLDDVIFDTFNGGLYGMLPNSNTPSTITFVNSSNLFNTLGLGAKIEDLIICGSVNANSMLVNTNNGLINNVIVDIYNNGTNYVASKVTSQDIAGGLVQVNNATVSNCTFAGSIEGTVVGGIAGVNNGQIISCNVLFYNMPDNYMKFKGDTVGGIVGELDGASHISLSYAYNYSSQIVLDGTNCGGIVGTISSNSSSISQCFAEINVKQIYANKSDEVTNSDTALIFNSYTISKTTQEETEVVIFNYFITTATGSKISGETSDPNSAFGSTVYGSKEVWNRNNLTNYKFPYLNNVRPVEALNSEELNNLAINTTRLSLQESSNNAVMFLYDSENTILTTAEQKILRLKNTISVSELLGTTKTSGIVISSSNNGIIQSNGNELIVKSIGTTTLTVNSKYDLTIQAKEITVTVIYYTSVLTLTHNNQVIGNYSGIGIRTNKNETIKSSLTNKIVLVDRQVNIAQNNYDVKFVQKTTQDNEVVEQNFNYISGNKIGSHVISNLFNQDNIDIFVFLQLEDASNIVNQIIKKYSLKQFKLIKSYGPISVSSTARDAEISPSDELPAYIDVVSDTNYKQQLGSENEIVVKVYDSNNNLITNVIFVDLSVVSVTNTSNQTTTTKYKAIIKINSQIKEFDPNGYVVKFETIYEDIYKSIKIKVMSQEVLRIDIYNYAQRYSTESGNSYFGYYPNNVLSPNTSGLLDVIIYPSYASYTHITVTSPTVNNQSLNFVSMQKATAGGYCVDLSTNFEFVKDGIKIYAKQDISSEFARYYIKTIVPSGVSIDTVYQISVQVWNNDTVVYTEIYPLIIVPQEEAGITVNGQSTIYAVRGDVITADLVMDQSQTLKSIEVLNKNDDTLIRETVANFNNDFEEYATKYFKGTVTIHIDEYAEHFKVKVTSSRFVNGIEETVSSYLIVYVIDFELDIENTHLSNNDGSDIIYGDKYFYHTLEFAFAAKYQIKEDGSKSNGQLSFEEFVENKTFTRLDYVVNKIGENTNTLIENLYYVNDNSFTPVVNKTQNGYENAQNNIIKEITINDNNQLCFIGRNNGTQQMLLEIQATMPDQNIRTYRYFFSISIQDPTSDDSPNQISNATEFVSALENETAEDYILTNNIFLYDYEIAPNTSKLRSLDGNGYQIVIIGFATVEQSTANYALFETVSENTTLKNLRVNVYHTNTIYVNSAQTSIVNVAPIAINNTGIITNCEVVSYRYFTNEINPQVSGICVETNTALNITAKTSGFVINNSGVITNSRVGGESINIYSVNRNNNGPVSVNKSVQILSPFTVSSFGEISGFVHTNSGHISSSYTSNIRVINNSNIDYTTITAGFVVYNTGTISMSYSKGVRDSQTEVHATKYGIETSGISAGFAYSNAGKITDSYSNITLTNLGNNPGRNSAGFVYVNTEKGNIKTSLSLSRITGSTTTQMNFVGVDDFGNYQNNGEIENSYYYDQVAVEDSSILLETEYKNGAKFVSSVVLQDYFYGFNFSRDDADGIWTMTTIGPELVSANDIAVSLRYASNQTEGKPIFAYVDEFRYGSKNNPILIRTAEEFNKVFSGTDNTSASLYVNVEKSQVYGSYRLVGDINLQELVSAESGMYKLSSSKMELTGYYQNQGNGLSIGKFDGNGFTISGFALSDSGLSSSTESFGLFSKITSNAIVMNLNVILGSRNAEDDIFGLEAKGIKYVGALAGTVSDSKVVNVALSSVYPNTNSVTVRGKNVVGGIIGRVIGNSYVSNLTAKDISVTSVLYPSNYVKYNNQDSYLSYNSYSRTNEAINNNISYAGGIIGLIDTYTSSTITKEDYADSIISSNSNALMLKTLGVSKISGGTVGGVFGYVGPLAIVQDALYELTKVEDYTTQGLHSYNGFAGGIAGFNAGYLRQVRSEHEQLWQIGDNDPNDANDNSIEANINSYYQGETVDRGNTTLFDTQNYTPIAIGGLVGLQKSGKIEKSYSKLNIISTKQNVIAGGIIGINQGITNNSYLPLTLEEVYASGDVQANTAAGVVGYSNSIIKFEKVNAINYWGEYLFNDSITPSISEIAYSFINSSTENEYINCSTISSNNLLFKGNKVSSSVFTDITIDTSVEEVPSLSNITGYGDDGAMYDSYFVGNDWDSDSWNRNDNELFPHIVFGYVSRIIHIKNQNDIEKMRTSKDTDIFVIDPEKNGINTVDNNQAFITINKPIAPIASFSGTLRGLDQNKTYGFAFVDRNQTRSLFATTVGATFSNFEIRYGNITLNNSSLSNNAVLVASAKGNTVFSNLTFNGINVVYSNSVSNNNIGIVTAEASSCTFENIAFINCQISSGSQISENGTLSLGYLFGKAENLDKNSISNIKFDISNSINISNEINSKNTSNIGFIGGQIIPSTDENLNLHFSKDSFVGNNIININNKAKNVNAGFIVGNAKNVIVSGIENQNENEINSNIQVIDNTSDKNAQLVSSNIGGIIGKADMCFVKNICVVPNINVQPSSTVGVCVGGIFGNSNNCQIKDSIVGKIQENDDTSNHIKVLKSNGNTYVGGVAGYMQSSNTSTLTTNNLDDVALHNVKVFANIYLDVNGEAELCAGGIAGQLNSSKVINVASYGNVQFNNTVSNNIEINSVRVYLASFVGYSSGCAYNKCYTFGDVKNVIGNISDKVQLVMSGFIAAVASSGKNETAITNSLSASNVYPIYEITQDKEYKSATDDILVKEVIYGGLVGYVNETLTITNNQILASYVNKQDRHIIEDENVYLANAIIGQCAENSTLKGEYADDVTLSSNKYAHVYTLVTDTFGQNIHLIDILNTLPNALGLDQEQDLEFKVWEEKLFGDLKLQGTKINPAKINENNSKEYNNSYIYLSSLQSEIRIGKLINSVLVSDGGTLDFSAEKEQTSPIDEIDENSIVSGIVIMAGYYGINNESEEKDEKIVVSGFANKNNGIIYSCNVRGRFEEGKKITGDIYSQNKIAGFVNINNGLIKESYTDLNLISTYYTETQKYTGQNQKGKTYVSAVAGFVLNYEFSDEKIKGKCISCYTSGTIKNLQENTTLEDDNNIALIYLFGAGNAYDCYTNAKLIYNENYKKDTFENLPTAKRVYAFQKKEKSENSAKEIIFNLENCFYDKYAAEAIVNCSNYKNEEVRMYKTPALNYQGTDDEFVQTVTDLDNNSVTYAGNLWLNKNYAYGYGSFVYGAYKNIEYMHHYTGNGTEDTPYQITNIGKLFQMNGLDDSNKQINYNLITDINASCLNDDIKWEAKDIKNVNLSGFDVVDNTQHKISNLNTQNGGIFANIESTSDPCTISNLILDNIVPTLQNYEPINATAYLGLLCNISKNYKITKIQVYTLDNSELIFNNQLGLLYYGNIAGGLINSNLLECAIVKDYNAVNNKNQQNENNYCRLTLSYYKGLNYVIGGFAGVVQDFSVISNSHIDNHFVVEFKDGALIENIKNKTFIVGSIAGLLKSTAKIEKSYLNGTMDILSINNHKDGLYTPTNLNNQLYVGGIVGAVGDVNLVGLDQGGAYIEDSSVVADSYKLQLTHNPVVGIVDTCYVVTNSDIFAGNHYIIDECYVGGISGFGGDIQDCYNRANNVIGRAKYSYDNETQIYSEAHNYTNSNAISETANVYIDGKGINGDGYEFGDINFARYQKMLYVKVTQKANVAGLCNSYDSILNSINYCENISGGMQARKLHSYYDVEYKQMFSIFMSHAAQVAISIGMIMFGYRLVSNAAYFGYPYGLAVASIGLSFMAGAIPMFVNSFGVLNSTIEVPVYTLEGNGYEEYHSTAYFPNLLKEDEIYEEEELFNALLNFINNTTFDIFNINQSSLTLPYGNPINRPEGETMYYKFLTPEHIPISDDDGWMGLYPVVASGKNCLYTPNDQMIVYDVYYDSIGYGRNVDSYSNAIARAGQVYQKYVIEGKNYYKLNDNGRVLNSKNFDNYIEDPKLRYAGNVSDTYGFLYSKPEDKPDNLGKTENVQNISDAEDWGWISEGDTFYPSSSAEVARTDLSEMLNENISITTTIYSKTATIEVNNINDYRSTIKLINNLPNSNIEEYIELYSSGASISEDLTNKLQQLQYIIQNNNTEIIQSVKLNINEDLIFTNIEPLGTVQYPFNGSINGTKGKGATRTLLQNAFVSKNTNSIGLFGYVNNLDIKNIEFSYNEIQYAVNIDNSANIGGLVGEVVSGGSVNISNCEVELNFKDYKTAKEISNVSSNIGGFIGKVNSGSNIEIKNSFITQFNVDLKCTQTVNTNNSIGGEIGYLENSTFTTKYTDVNISNMVGKSANTVFGGIIGYSSLSKINAEEVSLNGSIKIESTINSNAISGGFIGKLDDVTELILKDIYIMPSLISATAAYNNITTYAGGFIGYIETINNSVQPSISNLVIGNEGYENYLDRSFIMSGIGGTEYSYYAYADDLVGNRNSQSDFVSLLLQSNVHVYSKSLSFSNPNYKQQPVINNGVLETNSIIKSTQAHYDVSFSKQTTSASGESTTDISKNNNFIKIDTYEYKTQTNTNVENAYINGKQFTLYNYNKQYLIFIIKGRTQSEVIVDGDSSTIYQIEEQVYKYSINGLINQEGDYNIVQNNKLEFIKAYKYYSTKNFYTDVTNLGEAYQISNRTTSLYPKGLNSCIVKYKGVSGSGENTKLEYTKSNIESSLEHIEYISSNVIDLNYSIRKIDETMSMSDVEFENNKPIIGVQESVYNQNEEYRYQNISIEDGSLILNYTLTDQKTDTTITSEKTKTIVNNYGIYKTPQTSSNWKSIGYLSNSNIKLEDLESKTTSVVKFKNGNSTFTEEDINQKVHLNINSAEAKIAVLTSPIMRMDGKEDNKNVALIISTQNSSEQGRYRYKDYVYIINLSNGVYNTNYMGFIAYETDKELLEKDSDGLLYIQKFARNAMFFPEQNQIDGTPGYNMYRYENNLKSLSDINGMQNNDFAYSVKTEERNTIYYIDVSTNPSNFVFKNKTTIIENTYSVTINDITIKDFNNISVKLNLSASQSEPQISEFGQDVAISFDDDVEKFSIMNLDKYQIVDTFGVLNSNICVIGHDIGNGVEYKLYSFDYSNGNLAGYDVYLVNIIKNQISVDGISPTKYDSNGRALNTTRVSGINNFVASYYYNDNIDQTVVYLSLSDNSKSKTLKLDGQYEVASNSGMLKLSSKNSVVTYLIDYINEFVIVGHTYNQKFNGKDYTITETHITDTQKTLTVSDGTITNTFNIDVPVQESGYIEINNINQPKFFVLQLKQEVTCSDAETYLSVHTNINQNDLCLISLDNIEQIFMYQFSGEQRIVKMFVYTSQTIDQTTKINVYVQQFGEWYKLKGDLQIVKDMQNLGYSYNVTIDQTNSGIFKDETNIVTYIDICFSNSFKLSYDLDNGYIFNVTSTDGIASSIYTTRQMTYKKYSYSITYVNDEYKNHTKVYIIESGVVLDVDFVAGNIELVPFNGSDAIKVKENTTNGTIQYFTREGGYRILGVVAQEKVITKTSFGVTVGSGIYLLKTDASFINAQEEMVSVNEFVYARLNAEIEVPSNIETSIYISEIDEAKQDATLKRTVNKAGSTLTITDNVSYQVEGQAINVTYTYTYDVSSTICKYYKCSDDMDTDDYSQTLYSSKNTQNELKHNVILIEGITIDIVFGEQTKNII